MSNVGKSAELAAAACWHLGLDLPGLHEGLDSLSTCIHGLGIAGPRIFFRPFLLCFLAKRMFLRNLGSTPLRDSYRCDRGFLMPFLCHFRDWLCVVWFLDSAMSAPGPADAEARGTGREKHVPLFCDSMACSPPVSSAHGISQARILEWVANFFPSGSSPGAEPVPPALQGDSLPLSRQVASLVIR